MVRLMKLWDIVKTYFFPTWSIDELVLNVLFVFAATDDCTRKTAKSRIKLPICRISHMTELTMVETILFWYSSFLAEIKVNNEMRCCRVKSHKIIFSCWFVIVAFYYTCIFVLLGKNVDSIHIISMSENLVTISTIGKDI